MKNLGKKVLIVGVSASGKSLFARKLAEKVNLPLFLVDAIMWKPGWQYIGDEETVRRLQEIGTQEAWIIEGYIDKRAQPFILDRADTIIYLDYPPVVATIRYLKRWLQHRKKPRPELEGSPEKFSFEFLVRVWKKKEVYYLDKNLSHLQDQNKIIKLKSITETKKFLKDLPTN